MSFSFQTSFSSKIINLGAKREIRKRALKEVTDRINDFSIYNIYLLNSELHYHQKLSIRLARVLLNITDDFETL